MAIPLPMHQDVEKDRRRAIGKVPSKMLLQEIMKELQKRSFSLAFLQDLARSCGILQESCRNLVAISSRNAGEKDLFLEYLAILAIFLARAFLLAWTTNAIC